jgi:membrane protein
VPPAADPAPRRSGPAPTHDDGTGRRPTRVAHPAPADGSATPGDEPSRGPASGATQALGSPALPGSRHVHLARRTLDKAWHDRVLGLSAETAFWQLLSLPPLFLALLGSFGYLSGLLGPDTVNAAEDRLVEVFSRAFTPNVVDQVVQPTVTAVLRRGRADVISIGFLIALWAGSSATATFVNTITIAYDMRDLRGAVRSRLLALWLYLVSVLVGIVLLPVMVLGPTVLVDLLPASVRPSAANLVNDAYWPVVAGILLVALTSFYHLAVPKRLPWHRGVPGALLAMAVFLLGSIGLRAYISFVVSQGLTYGTLGAPIAALLFFFVLALAVLIGAELNATIEELWPSRPRRLRPPRLFRRRRRAPAPDGTP